MNGHTPGPWVACVGGFCPCGAIWDSSCEMHLATAFDETARGMDAFGSDTGVSRAERIANAHLIVAAPELLGSLQFAINHLNADTFIGDAIDEFHTMATAAIEKATKP